MRRNVLVHLLNRKPFKPFRLTVSNNESFEVRHPEAAYLAKRFIAVVRPLSEVTDAVTDEMVWIDYRHIVYCQPIYKREVPF